MAEDAFDRDAIERLIEEGKRYLDKGEPGAAEACFEQALALLGPASQILQLDLDKYRAVLHTLWGNALLDKGDLDGALGAYDKALALHQQAHLAHRPELDEDRAMLHEYRGLALDGKGNLDSLDKALGAYDKALVLYQNLTHRPELDENRARLHGNRGNALYRKGDLSGALAAYEAALALHQQTHLAHRLELDKDRAVLHEYRGLALYGKGELEGALRAYEAALALYQEAHLARRPELDEARARLHGNRGNALGVKGNPDGALGAYEAALALHREAHLARRPELDEARAVLHLNRGIALDGKGDLEEALGAWTEAERLYEGPNIGPWPPQNRKRCILYAVMAPLLPHLPDPQGWARDKSRRMAAMLECAPSVTEPRSPLRGMREDFARFHALWLEYCIECGELEVIPTILAVIQGRDLAAEMLDELSLNAPGATTPEKAPPVHAYQKLRLELRKLAALLQQLTGGDHDPFKGGGRLGSAEPPAPFDLQALQVRYLALYDELPRRRAEAAKVRGYEILMQPYADVDFPKLQRTLAEREALLLLLDLGGRQGALLIYRDRPPVWQALAGLRTVAHAVEQYSDQLGRTRGYRHGPVQQQAKEAPLPAAGALQPFWAHQAQDLAKELWQPLAPHLKGLQRLLCITHGHLHRLPVLAGAPAGLALAHYPGLVFYWMRRCPPVPAAGADYPVHLGLLAYPGDNQDIPLTEAETAMIAAQWRQVSPTITVEHPSAYPDSGCLLPTLDTVLTARPGVRGRR